MDVGGLPIPDELQSLIASGRWPRDADEARRQNCTAWVPGKRVAALAADESFIYLLPPPFYTVQQLAGGAERPFWTSPRADPEGIAFERTLVIADFGIGSDSPIVLDYRRDPPAVLRLRWAQGGEGNRWVEMAPTFREFAERLGLTVPPDRAV